MNRNYNENRNYRRTYEKAYQILQNTKHMREMAKSDRRNIRKDDEFERDLRNSDNLFHEIETETVSWRPDSRRRGGDLPQTLNRFESALHHSMRDYGVSSSWHRQHAGRPGNRR
jgi:hypothetical protein